VKKIASTGSGKEYPMRCLSGFAKLLRVNHARLWGALNIASTGRKEPTSPPASRIAPPNPSVEFFLGIHQIVIGIFFDIIGNALADADLTPIGFIFHPPT
jgi:hypothetical protein